jgi:hypothetical protein
MVNPLRLLRKTAEPAQPHAAALSEHNREGDAMLERILAETARSAPYRLAEERVTALKAKLADKLEARDFRGSIAPLGDDQRELIDAEHARDQLRPSGDLAALQAQRNQHAEKTEPLMREAAAEELIALAPAFMAAEAALLAIQLRVFAAAGLCDQISLSRHTGLFFGYGEYGRTYVARPLNPADQSQAHPAFRRYPSAPEAAQAARDAEGRELDKAIDNLRAKLLASRE